MRVFRTDASKLVSDHFSRAPRVKKDSYFVNFSNSTTVEENSFGKCCFTRVNMCRDTDVTQLLQVREEVVG